MKLIIQLQMGDWQKIRYGTPWLHFASSLSGEVIGTDLDNQSEVIVADLVLKLIDQSDSVFLLIIVNGPDVMLGSGLKVIRHCLKERERMNRIVLLGDHPPIEEIAAGFDERFVKVSREEEIKRHIREFAQ